MRLLYTIAHTFEFMGYTQIKARAAGYNSPQPIQGVRADHTPDLCCRQNDSRHTPLILDVVTPKEYLNVPEFDSRMSLFASTRPVWGCEFHIVVPNMKLSGEWLNERLKANLKLSGIIPNKIWSI